MMMTPTTLRALRQLLFFEPQDAARFLAATAEQPQGVPEQTWRQWENGEHPIPAHVCAKLNELVDWRAAALDATADSIRVQIREKGGKPESIYVIWYDALEDWVSLPNRDPVMWRLQQAVCAELRGMFSIVKLVPFDAEAYKAWLAGRQDDESLRAEWAGSIQG